MSSMMKPKVKVKSDSRPSAGTRVKGGGTEDMPVRVKGLPEPRVGRGGQNEFKPMPIMGRFPGEPEPGMGPVYGGGPSGRDGEMRMPPMMRGVPVPGPGGFDGAIGHPDWSQSDGPTPAEVGSNDRGMFMDARINPDGSYQGRNSDNEFDEWAPSHSDGQFRPGNDPNEAYAKAASDLMNRLGLVDSGSSTGRLSQQAIANGQTNDTGNPRLDFMPRQGLPRQGFREGEMDGRTPWEKMHKGQPISKKKKKKKRVYATAPKENFVDVMSGGVIKQPKGGN